MKSKQSASDPWIHALRPTAIAYFFPPLFLGQAIAFVVAEVFSWTAGLLALICGLGLYLASTSSNYQQSNNADPPPKILRSSALLALLVLCISCGCALYIDRWHILSIAAACLVLLWVYRFPPLHIEMRGGGEILQALGFGLLLPLIGYYAQTATWQPLPHTYFMPYILLQLAAAIGCALPSRATDSAAGKRTLPVLLGNGNAAAIAVAACLAAQYLVVWSRGLPILVLGLMLIPVATLLATAPLQRKLDDSPSHQRLFKGLVLSPGYIFALGFSLAQLWE